MYIRVHPDAASLAAIERWQGIITENPAASSVPGFKQTEAAFASVLAVATNGKVTVGSPGSAANFRVRAFHAGFLPD